jgi:carbonic anhydrase/acetyltransferase-like protein (isoleucine patch superfamily)
MFASLIAAAGALALTQARAEEEYHVNYMMYPEGTPGVNRVTSKHFCVVYGDHDKQGTWSREKAQGTLRNLEALWTVYVEKLKWTEPTECADAKAPLYKNGKKYKVNLFVLMTGLPKHGGGGGAWMTGHEGFACLLVDPVYLRVDPPSWATPHEFGHVMEMHQKGGFCNNPWSGCWWETYGNWIRERYLYDPAYPKAPETDFCWPYLETWQMVWPHGRNFYHCWMFPNYLEENPDKLPAYGIGFNKRIWNESVKDEYPVHTIIRLGSLETFKNALGHFAARMATLDLQQQRIYLEHFNKEVNDYRRRTLYTELKRLPDKAGWWRCPPEHAPQQMGLNVIRLVPEAAEVKVTFQGIADAARGSDWRACLVAVDEKGKARYSTLWSQGANSLKLSPGEKTLYLTVAATPDRFEPVNLNAATEQPYESHPARARFPYEVQLEGARPFETIPAKPADAKGRPHPNGGGFVADSAKADATAYIGPNALVLGRAKVLGQARVLDYATIRDDATVQDRAVVSGHATVAGRATVKDDARLSNYAWVQEAAVIAGHGRVLEHGVVGGNESLVSDHGIVKGSSWAYGKILGTGMADGDFNTGSTVTKGACFSWWWGTPREAQVYADKRPGACNLYLAYDFAKDGGPYARDRFGVAHGILRPSAGSGRPEPVEGRNAPKWAESLDGRSGVLTFNGRDQYVLLEDSVSSFRDTEIRCWIRWEGGEKNQPIWWFGSAPDRCMCLTPSGANGKAAFVIRKGEQTETLEGSGPLPTGSWHHVRLALSGGQGTLYVDGKPVAEGAIKLNPEDIQAPDVNTASNANYIARGTIGEDRYFAGVVDEFEVYSAAMNSGPRVFSLAAEKVGHDSVTFRGLLGHPGETEAATVRVHWGTKDGGSDADAWQNVETLTKQKAGDIALTKGGLASSTTYFYRLAAGDAKAANWASRSITFRTPDILEIAAGNVLWPKETSAYFQTRLPYSAGGKAEVLFYWGTKDGGADKKAWEHVLSAGQRDPGDQTFEINCEGLKPGTAYFVRAAAKNALGEKWADRTLRFTTRKPGESPK